MPTFCVLLPIGTAGRRCERRVRKFFGGLTWKKLGKILSVQGWPSNIACASLKAWHKRVTARKALSERKADRETCGLMNKQPDSQLPYGQMSSVDESQTSHPAASNPYDPSTVGCNEVLWEPYPTATLYSNAVSALWRRCEFKLHGLMAEDMTQMTAGV